MPHPARLLALFGLSAFVLPVFGADNAPPEKSTPPSKQSGRGLGRPQATSAPASDWIDPRTGHRIIRLSPDTGGSSLYFHQHSFTPEGDKLVIRGAGGIGVVDISKLG